MEYRFAAGNHQESRRRSDLRRKSRRVVGRANLESVRVQRAFERTIGAVRVELEQSRRLLLLKSPLSSALAAQRGFNKPPVPGLPDRPTVAQSLRPLPEYTGVVQTWTPLGNTWYDALQTKVTKRLSHGLDVVATYTFSKSLALGAEDNNNYASPTTPVINDVFNRGVNKTLSGFDQPQPFVFPGTTPLRNYSPGNGFISKLVSWAARDWSVGAVLRYASGFRSKSRTATSGLATYNFQQTNVNRVPGVPLFATTWVDMKGVTHTNEELDINCHCFDPSKTFVLNPAAWTNPAPGQFGTANAHYSDYRQERRPSESMSLARSFRIKERATVSVRAEFSNIFNRTGLNVPTYTNAFATQTRSAAHASRARRPREGLGYISSAAVGGAALQSRRGFHRDLRHATAERGHAGRTLYVLKSSVRKSAVACGRGSGFWGAGSDYFTRPAAQALRPRELCGPGLAADCHAELAHNLPTHRYGMLFTVPCRKYRKGITYYHEASASYFTMVSADGKCYQRRYQTGFDGKQTNVMEKQIDYVMGSGNHVRTYLNRTSRNTLIELPLAWYAEKGGYWAMNPGYDRPDHPGFRPHRTHTTACSATTRYPADPGSPSNKRPSRFPAACRKASTASDATVRAAEHGRQGMRGRRKAGRHSQRHRESGALSAERQMEVCMQCHLETTSLRCQIPSRVRTGRILLQAG